MGLQILNWMHSKLNGWKKENSTSTKSVGHGQNETGKPEISDWPQGLLTIGTLGNDDLGEDETNRRNPNHGQDPSSSQEHLQGLTQEELGKLQDKINSILLHKQQEDSAAELVETIDLRLDSIFNDISQAISVASPAHELRNNHGRQLLRANSSLSKKSLTFLLKKIFGCKSGFAHTPNLRDPIPETMMEKILRTLLHNKMYPQGSTSKLTKKIYLPKRHMTGFSDEDEIKHYDDDSTKWVTTDSEYIVLEI